MENSGREIAVIGMDVKIPGSNSLQEFWENLCGGRESIHDLTDVELLSAGVDYKLLHESNYVKRSSECDDYDCFDAEFFGYSEKEANIIDPQQRMFLESCWRALENAGYIPNKMKGRTGVFGSAGFNKYLINAVQAVPELMEDKTYYSTFIGNDKDYISTRVSYKLGLSGPSVTVQTACSSSLVGIHLACQSLLLYESDCCIAGGANVDVPLKTGYKYQDGFIRSKDGTCRSFDNESSGTIFGSGVGSVVLKRLEDAIEDKDNIYAVIRATAMNNDGSRKIGFTAPSREGQQDVMADAMELEGIEPESIVFVEAHGTGTSLGDPIELSSIMNTIGLSSVEDNKRYPCAIGSVKSNIGHLDAAAGVISFIKACLCINQKMIVPTVHFKHLNENISFQDTRFHIADKLEKITADYPARAMVNSLGIGGTNVCAFIEEYDNQQRYECETRDAYLVKVSAKSKYSLEQMKKNIVAAFPDKNIGSYCYTLNTKRGDYELRDFLLFARKESGIFNPMKAEELRDAMNAGIEVNGFIRTLYELGEQWKAGKEIDFTEFYKESECYTVPAPTYCFEKKKHWYTKLIARPSYIWMEQMKPFSVTEQFAENHSEGDVVIIGKEQQAFQIKELLVKANVLCNSIECLTNKEEKQAKIQELFTQKYVNRDIYIIFTYGLEECKDVEGYYQSVLTDCRSIRGYFNHTIHVTLLEALYHGTENIAAAGMAYGLVTSLPMEMEKIKMYQIIFDAEADLAGNLGWEDLIFSTSPHSKFYVQKGQIFTPQYVQTKQEKKEIRLRDAGNYVITGGTGNVGLLFADEICKRAKANIYLVSANYSEEKLKEEQDEKSSIIYQRIQEMRERASSVHILTYNLSNETEVYNLEQYFAENRIEVDGIIHAAGKVGKARDFAEEITIETVKEYTAVKLKMAKRIMELNRKVPFSFCIFISSTVSVLGGLGDSIYSGCNAALNYLLEYGDKEVNSNIKAVAFDYLPRVFADEFFHADESKYRGLYANTLTVEEFSDMFDQFMDTESKLLVISKTDMNQRIKTFHFDKGNDKAVQTKANWTRDEIEREIRSIWSEVLGVYCEDDRNFFDAGGDSLLAVGLISGLSSSFDNDFTIKYVFKYPTIKLMVDDIERRVNKKDNKKQKIEVTNSNKKDISVIGMAGLFPGADNIDELWNLIMNKTCAISHFDSSYYKDVQENSGLKKLNVRGIVHDADKFDYEFFRISKYEAERMDPQQRKFLEVAWTALEDAGCINDVEDVKIGVFASQGVSTYYIHNLLGKDCTKKDYTYTVLMNNSPDALATRVSYTFNLTGVSRTIQSFCSSSLNAMDDAIKSLINGDCDVCLVGGVNIEIPQERGYVYKEGSIFSATGKVHPFDESADGTIFSNGVGAVVIANSDWAKKRGCHIYADILGVNSNNDGMQKVSYLSPSVKGQVDCISGAYEKAGIDPERVVYIETHGTATKIGDPIEVLSLTEAFENYTDKKQFCALGSIKANLGHLDRASGITSFIKGCLIAQKRCLPPQAMYENANENINFEETPFYVNTEPIELEKDKDMVVGVTSLGVGGTNVHIILENKQKPELQKDVYKEDETYIINISAKSQNSLLRFLHEFTAYIEDNTCEVRDIESTLMYFRKEFSIRKSFCVRSKEELVHELKVYLRKSIEEEYQEKVNTILFDTDMEQKSIRELILKMKYSGKQFKELYDQMIGTDDLDSITSHLIRSFIRKCIKEVAEEPVIVLFEKLSSVAIDNRTVVVSTARKEDNRNGINIDPENVLFFSQLLSVLWESGIKMNWQWYKEYAIKRNIHLPGYAFQKNSCWIE